MKRSVFVLEDESLILWSIKSALEKRGYYVEGAGTLEEARRTLLKRCFDIYIIDVYLPDGSGLELIEKIRLHRDRAKIFILTAYPHLYCIRRKLIEGEVDGLIKKPFRLEDVIKMLEGR